MKKAIKVFLITIFALLLLVTVGTYILTKLVDPTVFKETISQQVEKMTGRKLTINGRIGWSVFPSASIELSDASLANAKGFNKSPFAKVTKMKFSVQTLPLLSGRVKINKITFDKPVFNLAINKKGISNWQDLGQNAPAAATSSKSNMSSKSGSSYFDIKDMHIHSIIIKDAAIHWDNQKTKQHLEISKLNFTSYSIAPGKLFPIDVKFNVIGKNPKIITAVRLVTNMKLDIDQNTLNQPNLGITLARALQMQGHLSIPNISTEKFHATDLKGNIDAKGGVIRIDPFKANAYGGKSNGKLMVDLRGNTPKYALSESLQGIQASALFYDIMGAKRFTGTGHFSANLFSSGRTTSAIISNLSGSTKFAFTNGRLQGVDLLYVSQWASAFFGKQPNPSANKGGDTSFGNMSGSGIIKRGVVYSNDLLLDSPAIKVTAQGEANLNSSRLNYNIRAKVLNLNEENPVGKLQKIMGGSIPLRVSGTFTNPKTTPDFKQILKVRTKSFIDRIGKKSGKDAKKIFKRIFD